MIEPTLLISPNLYRYGDGPVRMCAELPDQIYDKDCIMKFEASPDWNLYYFFCYCTTDGCNNFNDAPPCGSVAGYCEPPPHPTNFLK